MIRKIIISCIAATSLILFSTQAFALLNFSVGVPLSHSMTGQFIGGDDIESEGVSGTFVQIGVPILPGIGMDNIESKVGSDIKIATTIYNLYYLLPIPVINLTFGVGVGSTEFKCEGCSSLYDKGATSQWYTSFGMPIMPLFDLHLSYRSVSSKIEMITGSDKGKKDDVGGNVMGLGIGFNF